MPQARLQSLLEKFVRDGRERGAQLAVYHDGRLVVDAWAGVCDVRTRTPVDARTLFPVFSVGKGIAATIVHRLANRGVLDYDTPVASVWPEFAARDKEGVTVRHVLNHTAGLPFLPAGIGFAELNDWKIMTGALAAQPPAWPPGTVAEYHAMTYGWLVAEIVQRATGKAFEQILEEEIRRPLGMEDLYMGIPDAVEPRVATLEENPVTPARAPDPHREAIPRWVLPLAETMNRPDARRGCFPGFGGIMNARSIARHYAALLPGGVDGIELLPPNRVRLATEPQGFRNSLGETMKWLLGYHSCDDPYDPAGRARSFGHEGHGGSFGYADLSRGLAIGFTRNHYLDSQTRPEIAAALYAFFPPR